MEQKLKEHDTICADKMNMRIKTELHYVKTGDIVSFTYILALMLECKEKGCNVFDFITISEDAKSINAMVDWLIKNYPQDFELV